MFGLQASGREPGSATIYRKLCTGPLYRKLCLGSRERGIASSVLLFLLSAALMVHPLVTIDHRYEPSPCREVQAPGWGHVPGESHVRRDRDHQVELFLRQVPFFHPPLPLLRLSPQDLLPTSSKEDADMSWTVVSGGSAGGMASELGGDLVDRQIAEEASAKPCEFHRVSCPTA